MSEKYYKPIMKNGDHLASSKKTPGRVRGVSFDKDNKNPDIVEWEEVKINDSSQYKDNPVQPSYNNKKIELSPEEEKIVQEIGEMIGYVIVIGGVTLIKKVLVPWWENTAWPFIKSKVENIKRGFTSKKGKAETTECKKEKMELSNYKYEEIGKKIDEAFEDSMFDMNSEEVQECVMNIIYHLFFVAYEIRRISNSRIKDKCLSREKCIEEQEQFEKYLSGKVALHLNQLLSDEHLSLDAKTSKQIFNLLGGGITKNGQYVPVKIDRVEAVVKKQNI